MHLPQKKSLLEMNGWGWDLTMVMARPFLCCRTALGVSSGTVPAAILVVGDFFIYFFLCI